jgi:N-acetylneuraminic acid mutarotase
MPGAPAYAAITAIALDGLLYVIGGCTIDFCGTTDVFVYDPDADSWTAAASYPRDVSWTHCGAIDGQIICAGGVSDSEGELDATYAYDPGSDSWTELAPLPQTQWAGGYVASGGMLLVSGGVTDNFETVTNEGFAYDPAADSWSPIPASNNTVYRGASACGFYKVGGSTFGFEPIDAVELLPDLDECGVAPDVTWLSEEPVSGSVAADDSTIITLTFDAGVEAVNQPGAYRATLRFKEDTPYPTAPVNVVMNVTPPADWGKLDGTVEGLERCDTPGAPLSGAAVHVDGVDADFDLKTDADGYFEWWMPADNDPLSLSVAKAGWVTKTRGSVSITAGDVTTSNFALRLDAPCAETNPDGLEVTLLQNDSETLNLRLQNRHGAAGYDFSIDEAPFAFRHLSPSNELTANRSVHRAAPTGPLSARSINDRNGTNVVQPAAPPWFGANDIPGGLVRFGHAQCDADPNTLYVVGGVDGTFDLSDKLWRFDAATTEWTELAPIPEAMEGPTATCDAGRIHVMGGGGTDLHFVYSIAGDTWTTAAPLPRPVWGAAAASWDGYVFLVGGDDDFFFGGSSDEVDVYDTVTDTWIGSGSPMPVGTTTPGFFQSTHYLYVAGGWGEESPDVNVEAVQRYDLLTDTWETGPSLGFPRADFALAGTDTALYAIAGDEDGGSPFDPTRVVERLELADWPDGAWSEIDRIGVPLTMNNGGFCTTATLDEGTEVWSAGGLEGSSGAISGRMLFRQAAGEKCTTYRANLPWLTEAPRTGGVAHDAAKTVEVTVDADDLSVGEHDATLLVTTEDPAHPEMRVAIHVTVVARPIVAYLSVGSAATIDGVSIKNEDVFIVHDDDSVEMSFDGSDLSMGGVVIDAFAFADDGSLVMSFTEPVGVPGITGTVDDSDLVKFVADSLGPDTAGTFVRYFDGSDVGLTTDAEDIDGLEIRPNGMIFISTVGGADLPGLGSADDSDIVKFDPDSLGGNTSGSWGRYFDGSDVGLTTDSEDVDAVALWSGAIGVSTTGRMEVSGLTSADEDVSVFHPTQTGGNTLGSWLGRLFDGSHFGLSENDVTGVEIAP